MGSGGIQIRKDLKFGFPKDGNKPPELINKIFAKKDDSFSKHLGEDAANRPDIDGFGVVIWVDEDFWGSVGSGGDVKGILIVDDFLFSEIHVSYFQLQFLADKYVVWFEIPVDDIGGMHEENSAQQLVEDELDHLLGEGGLLALGQSFEGVFHVFHAEIDLFEGIFALDFEDVLQADDIPMFQKF